MPRHQSLDICTTPLFGRRLIEANAGTGKTYTIVALYVRLILGLQDEYSFKRPLLPTEILVVTFTRAATAELKERIRNRLKEALTTLESGFSTDEWLKKLLLNQDDQKRIYLERLKLALRMLDEAAIYTIHSFCQRTLSRYAFLSGMPFKVQLIAQNDELLIEVIKDYWRNQYYPLLPDQQQLLSQYWPKGPLTLAKELKKIFRADIEGNFIFRQNKIAYSHSLINIFDKINVFLEKLSSQNFKVRKLYKTSEFDHYFNENLVNKFKKNQIDSHKINQHIQIFQRWILSEKNYLTEDMFYENKPKKQKLAWLGRVHLERSLKKNEALTPYPLLDALDELCDLTLKLPDIRPELLQHAWKNCSEILQEKKLSQAKLEYQDLLILLDNALKKDAKKQLAEQIRQALPVALIDEFQDTDSRQYAIFNHIYPLNTPIQEYALFFIGDPKQAIYSFRNADIRSYLLAEKTVQSRFVLTRNYRSSKQMVEAINGLLEKGNSAFLAQGLNCELSEAEGLKKQMIVENKPVIPLTFWLAQARQTVHQSDYLKQMSESVCSDIQRLLDSAKINQTGFVDDNGLFTPLSVANIAILVRTNHEAKIMMNALRKANKACVYLSQKENVFNSQAAYWLWQILQSLVYAQQEHYLKILFATQLFNEKIEFAQSLFDTPSRWQFITHRFMHYRQVLNQHGLLAVIYQLIDDFSLAARLLRLKNGERLLTDFLHASELVQQASQQFEGSMALLRWLEQQIQGEFSDQFADETAIERLDNDHELIKIITIHKAKGLEFDLVYLPFITANSNYLAREKTFISHEQNAKRVMVFDHDPALLQTALEDSRQEALRLFYVALTRARFACRMGIAPLSLTQKVQDDPEALTSLNNSGFGQLIHESEEISLKQFYNFIDALPESNLLSVETPKTIDFVPKLEIKLRDLKAKIFSGKIDSNWWISSYSALTQSLNTSFSINEITKNTGTFKSLSMDNEVFNEIEKINHKSDETFNFLSFPSGASAGTFLHHLLEQVDFSKCNDKAYQAYLLNDITKRLQMTPYPKQWNLILQKWMLKLCQITLWPDSSLRLEKLETWQSEVEFWLPNHMIKASELDALIQRYECIHSAQMYFPLQTRVLNGMLRGFIDLVFCYENRWYLLDWKSNHLGDQAENYHQDAILDTIKKHRYDVQYSLYALAWHRLLVSRLENYSYEKNFGGVIYWFIRGAHFDSPYQGLFCRKPDAKLIDGLDKLFKQPQEVSHDVY